MHSSTWVLAAHVTVSVAQMTCSDLSAPPPSPSLRSWAAIWPGRALGTLSGCTILLIHTSLMLPPLLFLPPPPPLVDTLEQGSELGMDSTIPRHWCFLTSQGTDGSLHLPTLGICTSWVLAGFVCLYIGAGCLPSTSSLQFLVKFLVPRNPVGHSSLLTSIKACLPS